MNSSFTSQLIEARTNRGLTQEQLAKKMNVDIELYKKIEAGIYDPTLSELITISEALNWSFKIGDVMI